MYLRPVFTETNQDRILALIEAHPFGVLVTGQGGLDASHIPFVVERDGTGGFALIAHLARANPQSGQLDGGRALAIFSGPHAYVAPGWYAAQPAVPTWDYAAVHVHGVLAPVADSDGISRMMRAASAHDPEGFDVDALEPRYREMMYNGISAFRLLPDKVEAQWKMSQNRSATDRTRVIAALRAEGRTEVAALIEATLPAG